MQLPKEFIPLAQEVVGEDQWPVFAEALNAPPVVSVRFNSKGGEEDLKSHFPALSAPVPWCKSGYYLSARPAFTLDPFLHMGLYYVQEASSMFLSQALQSYVPKTSLVLDMCAAPGGKSTLIAQHLEDEGFLVSNEFVRSRAYILSENVQKWGNHRTMVTNNSAEDFEGFRGLFDAILVDAPCSGEGMFRKEAQALTEWSLRNVDQCVERQRTILAAMWTALAPDGVLIYSTCTYNKKENEEQVRWLLETYEAEFLTLDLVPSWQVTATEFGYRFLPHKTKGEGLFLAVIRKREDGRRFKLKPMKQGLEVDKTIPLDYLKTSSSYVALTQREQSYAILKKDKALCDYLWTKLKGLHVGVPIGQMKGKTLIPAPGLALSKQLDLTKVQTYAFSLEEALNFLRCESLTLSDAPLGLLLVTYEGHPLGWVKNLGKRCNNLYDKAWRIRHL